jgi:hypothetical protein
VIFPVLTSTPVASIRFSVFGSYLVVVVSLVLGSGGAVCVGLPVLRLYLVKPSYKLSLPTLIILGSTLAWQLPQSRMWLSPINIHSVMKFLLASGFPGFFNLKKFHQFLSIFKKRIEGKALSLSFTRK